MTKKITRSFTITPQQEEHLNRRAAFYGITVADVVRRIIDADREQHPAPVAKPKGKSK